MPLNKKDDKQLEISEWVNTHNQTGIIEKLKANTKRFFEWIFWQNNTKKKIYSIENWIMAFEIEITNAIEWVLNDINSDEIKKQYIWLLTDAIRIKARLWAEKTKLLHRLTNPFKLDSFMSDLEDYEKDELQIQREIDFFWWSLRWLILNSALPREERMKIIQEYEDFMNWKYSFLFLKESLN